MILSTRPRSPSRSRARRTSRPAWRRGRARRDPRTGRVLAARSATSHGSGHADHLGGRVGAGPPHAPCAHTALMKRDQRARRQPPPPPRPSPRFPRILHSQVLPFLAVPRVNPCVNPHEKAEAWHAGRRDTPLLFCTRRGMYFIAFLPPLPRTRAARARAR
jgi:hypothetical protein